MLQLAVQSWVNSNNAYTITELRPDGTVVLDGSICQHISGIVNFVLV